MPRRPVRFAIWWMAGLGLVLAAVLIWLPALGSVLGLGGPKIGVVEILGEIDRPEPILETLVGLRRDSAVKAVILRIDSPGGSVAPFQEIYREVLKTREKKKVVASLGTVAASGGYYVAAAADKVMANPGTATGSIGVIIPLRNLRGLLDKLGIDQGAVTSGKFKDAGSPNRPLTDEERQLFQDLVDDVHDQFVRAVAQGRRLERSRVEPIADGRLLTGSQALKLGLVDKLGNFQDAVELAGTLAGISGEPELVWPGREQETFLGRIIRETLNSVAGSFVQSLEGVLSRYGTPH